MKKETEAKIRALLAMSWEPQRIARETECFVIEVYRIRSKMRVEDASLVDAKEEIRRRAALRIRHRPGHVEARPRARSSRSPAPDPTPASTSDRGDPMGEIKRCARCHLIEPHVCVVFLSERTKP